MTRIMGVAAAVCLAIPSIAQEEAPARVEATLGLQSREPSRDEAKAYGLPFKVRVQGQIVTEVEKDGPAAKAGIAPGDAILDLDKNRIYSGDHVADFLRTAKPGAEAKVRIRRAKTHKEEVIAVVLGSRKVKAGGIEWEFASLEQLDAALARAKKLGRRVLMGITGAET